jgi:vacuolar-type H+-ATPase subunit I/STV1
MQKDRLVRQKQNLEQKVKQLERQKLEIKNKIQDLESFIKSSTFEEKIREIVIKEIDEKRSQIKKQLEDFRYGDRIAKIN